MTPSRWWAKLYNTAQTRVLSGGCAGHGYIGNRGAYFFTHIATILSSLLLTNSIAATHDSIPENSCIATP